MPNGFTATDDLLTAVIAESKRLEEDALYSHAGHNVAARSADRLDGLLGVPTTILAAAAGVTSFSSAAVNNIPTGFWSSILAGILSFGVAALSQVRTFLDPNKKSASHYLAANAYAAYRTDARFFHEIECRTGKPTPELSEELVRLKERLKKLDEQTPIISGPAMLEAKQKIEAGYFTYAVDKAGSKG
jgi:hypothetical protein